MLQKNFTFPPQFQANFGILALIEVKKGTFSAENLPPTFAFPPQFLPFPERRKGSKFEPCKFDYHIQAKPVKCLKLHVALLMKTYPVFRAYASCMI